MTSILKKNDGYWITFINSPEYWKCGCFFRTFQKVQAQADDVVTKAQIQYCSLFWVGPFFLIRDRYKFEIVPLLIGFFLSEIGSTNRYIFF